MDDWGTKIEGGWFDDRIDQSTGRERHLYRREDGTPVISSTQVFDLLGLSDFSKIEPETLEFKRVYGGALHKCMQFLVSKDLDWDTVDDVLMSPLCAIESFLKRIEFVPDAAEEMRVFSLFGMFYGLTLDLRGTLMHQGVRRKAVLDLKTGTKFSETWNWQLGSYIYPQPKAELPWMGIIIQVSADGKVVPHYLKDPEKAKREFQILLATANLGLNAGLYKIAKAA